MKIIVYGNSGSGKSTAARILAEAQALAYLDLDTIAWEKDAPGVRASRAFSLSALRKFSEATENWVIEGCYGGLVQDALVYADRLIFLNPGTEDCLENCRRRPWEPHKYPTKEAQDKNLEMLLAWVAQYESRTDEFSKSTHQQIFETFEGIKDEWKSNEEINKRTLDLANHLSQG